ncbi:hypothetical protein Tco_1145737, partial [Tanacetum coccineum]
MVSAGKQIMGRSRHMMKELNHALMAFTENNGGVSCASTFLDSYNALQAKYAELQSEILYVKMGLGYGIQSNAKVLGYEEEISRGIFVSRETDAGNYDIPLYSRFKQPILKIMQNIQSGICLLLEEVNCSIMEKVRIDPASRTKRPYKLLVCHKPILSYIRPFGCHVTILNTLSPLGKFDGKSDEGFLVGYSVNRKSQKPLKMKAGWKLYAGSNYCSIKASTILSMDVKSAFAETATIDEEGVDSNLPGIVLILIHPTQSLIRLEQSRFQMSAMVNLHFFPMSTSQSEQVEESSISRQYVARYQKFALIYDRESPLDLEAFSDTDYGGSKLDRKSTTGLIWPSMDAREECQVFNWCTLYALTTNPTIYDSLIKQFWQTATANTIADGTLEITATIDTIRYTISEASIRDSLQLNDATGITMLPNEELFEGMGQIGYPTDGTFTFWKSFFTPQWRYLVHHLLHCISSKSGGWDQFGSNIATALVCLSTSRVYNFSKLIFDGMVANLKSKTKFLMYPRFLQMILNTQTENKHFYLAVSLTKKIFGNMKRGFRGAPRPLLPAMLLVATNPNAGQEHDAVAQSQPSSSTTPVPSTPPPIPIPTPTPPPIPTPTPPFIPTPTPPPIPTPTPPFIPTPTPPFIPTPTPPPIPIPTPTPTPPPIPTPTPPFIPTPTPPPIPTPTPTPI